MSIELYFDQFKDSKVSAVCSLFQAAAHDTWERIGFSRGTPGLKIHETTITQNLVYELNLLKWKMGLKGLTLYESRLEATNGHDLELCVRQKGGWYTYWLQSKILYHSMRKNKKVRLDNGQYPQFHHRVGHESQIDMLLRRAQEEKVIPLYLLYNFVSAPVNASSLCFSPIEKSQYGCTLVSAQLLKDQFSDKANNLRKNARFSQLHPAFAQPWLILTCCLPQSTLAQTFQLLQLPDDYPARPLERAPSANVEQWTLLTGEAPTESNYFPSSQRVIGFAPRYRMLIDTMLSPPEAPRSNV